MMDLSDGLAKDLPRLADASRCGFLIHEPSLPLSPGCSPAEALCDGEDFELLFSIEASRIPDLLNTWPFPDLPLTRIGELVETGAGQSLTGGWEHFT
jgi:thiamine-monophosphate kinase